MEIFGLSNGCLPICTLSSFSARVAWIWDYCRCTFVQSPSLSALALCVISYPLCSEKHLSHAPQEKTLQGWNLVFGNCPVVSCGSAWDERTNTFFLKLTFINWRTKQHQEANFTKSIATFFANSGSLVMAAYKQQAPRLHYILTTERELTQPILKAVVFPLDHAELQSEGKDTETIKWIK